MRLRKLIMVTILPLLLGACDGSTSRLEMGGRERIDARLDENAAILITTPADGGYAGKTHVGSGAIVARITDAAFSREARLVDVYPTDYQSLDALRDTIAKNGYSYIVVPTIAVWWGHKDQEWSQVPNQVRLRVVVLDAKTGKEISSNFLEGKDPEPGSLAGFFDPSATLPEDLLKNAMDDYVDTLYGVMLPHRPW